MFSTACDSASIISVVSKWRPSVLSSIGATENSRVDGDESHVAFGQKFTGEKGSVRRCVVMQLPVLLLPKFGGKSSHIFMLLP
jgi:hypothetical protein